MKDIYLEEREETTVLFEEIVVDKIPPKSCYFDTNISGVIGSKTFKLADVDTLKKLVRDSVE